MLMAIRFGALRAGQLRTRVSAAPASEIANRFFGIFLPLLDGTVRGENAAHGARVLALGDSTRPMGRAYWRLETGSRTAYALQFAMDNGPAAGVAAAACAAIETDRRALRMVAS